MAVSLIPVHKYRYMPEAATEALAGSETNHYGNLQEIARFRAMHVFCPCPEIVSDQGMIPIVKF